MGISIPIFGALLNGKSESLYQAVLSFMQNIFPEFKPKEMMVDFERGLKNALCAVWPDSVVRGCRFHYCQACIRMVGKKGLKRDFQKNNRVKAWIKGSLGLCLLPANSIVEEWRKHSLKLADFQANPTLFKKLNNYKKYIDTYWIGTVGVENFSVFGAANKTNNNAESLNSRLGKDFKVKHPGFWTFMDLYKKSVINQTKNDLAILFQGRLPRRSRKEDKNLEKIKLYEQKVRDGSWTAEHYLKIASNLFSKFSIPNVGPEEEEVEEENVEILEDRPVQEELSVEQLQSVMCIRCLEKLKDCMLQPCFHWIICHHCASQLKEEASEGELPNCPLCQSPFTGIIQPQNALN